MGKYLRKILLFFLLVVVIDCLFGLAFQYMNDHSKGGGVRSRHYVCKESKEDVLIFGSSRAKHHYVPDLIEDSLQMTCYNTGEDGNGILLCYGFMKMITDRHTPKLVIYDVTGFDMYEDDNMKYLDLMKPYYYEKGIDSIFWSVEPKTRVMMLSNLYRYNTTCLRVFGNYLHPMTNYPKGYLALNGIMDQEPIIYNEEPGNVDTLKIRYFERLISLAKSKGINLVCCCSPSYKASINQDYCQPIRQLCLQYNVPFLYYGDDSDISLEKSFFQDRTHLNDKGARLFTNKLISWIKSNKSII
ncbi:MAG: hypothetical protein K6A41_05745 [Bacteroidales bacterium]|nr:hypothetical protein [Bacteroidales bacterium]